LAAKERKESGGAHYRSYTFDFENQPTILEVLRKIRDVKDVNLAFRESGGLGKCGSCAVMTNGNPVLTCWTPLVKRSGFHDRLSEMRGFHAHPDHLRPEEKPL
jgi:succinate dehydrogenase/fumarate reductase-like Fe-S protein